MGLIGIIPLLLLFLLFRSGRKRVIMETENSVNSPRVKSLLSGWSSAILVNGLALLLGLEGLTRLIQGTSTHAAVILITLAIIVGGPVTFVYISLERQVAKALREHGEAEPSLTVLVSAYRSRQSSSALVAAVLTFMSAVYSLLQIVDPSVYNNGHSSSFAVTTLVTSIGLSVYALWVFRFSRSGTGGLLDWFRGK